MCHMCVIDQRAQVANGSLADVMVFGSWPEEHKRIARVGVSYEDSHEDATKESFEGGRATMRDDVEREYRGIVSEHRVIKGVLEEMLFDTRHGLVITPERLDALLKLVEELPAELSND